MLGCQSSPKQYVPPLPSNLSNGCPLLSVPVDGTGGSLLTWSVNTVYDYKACAYKYNQTIELYNKMREVINGS